MKSVFSLVSRHIAFLSFVLLLCLTLTAHAREPQGTFSVSVSAGWNLVSLPANVTNSSVYSLFPSAISPAYIFSSSAGYQSRDTVAPGIGFWLKFGSADTVVISGNDIFKDTIECEAGWNMIGSISLPVDTGAVVTEPPGLIASNFFEDVPGVGYTQVSTIRPAHGYWVKTREAGLIILASPGGQPCPGAPTVEYEGKTYSTVLIGSQCWLGQNLDVGVMVIGSQGQTNNATIEKYCYGDNPTNCATYGGLYQWNEAMQYDTTEGARAICPPGWHMPALAEFETLRASVGDDGNALKSVGQGSGSGQGTDTSGFSALLAGGRDRTYGGFYALGYYGYHWSSSLWQYDAADAFYLRLRADDASIYLYPYPRSYGFSVRCLKDTSNSPPDAPSDPAPADGSAGQSPSVMLGWSCSDPDGDPLTYDVYFGANNPPDAMVSSNQTDSTFGISGVSGGTTYYWRVVARDVPADTPSGPVWSFTTGAIGGSPCPGTPTVFYAGQTYNTVQIGSQCWLRENLDAGTMILGSANQTNNSIIEKYCYHDSSVNCDNYGGLYQWNEAMQYDATQGICPPGGHIPTLAEFQTLSSTTRGWSDGRNCDLRLSLKRNSCD